MTVILIMDSYLLQLNVNHVITSFETIQCPMIALKIFLVQIDHFQAYSSVSALWNHNVLGREEPLYSNEFAVHIPDGNEVADEIAAKHGFVNRGQVSRSLYIYSILK
ncbi:hypothetical protein Zmor_015772 [Zophobas morio]|uniref:Peptidase S8 pro-domain domain-containing protein n=1 Tax=Zophobas morio TaxID=2755281 RepID=A0AA38MHT0_9CUCU|nr:hypothetical protein Zmor_015772 [Zophobas morio]